MPPRRSTFNFGRLGMLAYFGSICLAVVAIANGMNEHQTLRGVSTALAFLLAGFLIAGILNAISAAMGRIDDLSRQMSETAADQTSAARSLTTKIDEALQAIRQQSLQHQDLSDGEPELPAEAIDVPPSQPVTAVMDERVITMLEEIRELALMNDDDRRARLQQHLDARRRALLDDVHFCIKSGEWARADRSLTELEIQFPGDAAVKQARSELLRQRDAAENDAYRSTEERVQDLIAVASWNKAIETASQFVDNFPTSMKGRQLLTRVRHDYDQYRDGAFQRMYEDVQSRVDRHEWRDAMESAQKLLDSFPTHSRSNRIRQQLKIIRENAEIEERQEQELRIQQLVRGRRFAEAVELAEEVVRKFPDSPQAIAIDQMLPRLRDLAEHGDESDEPVAT